MASVGVVAFLCAQTPPNLKVLRFGDGTMPLSAASTQAFWDVYSDAGALIAKIPVPVNPPLPHKTMTVSGIATSEGGLSVSEDGQYLVCAGYNVAPGFPSVATSTSVAVPRVIARIDRNGIIDTTTTLGTAFSGANIRSATSVDGMQFYSTGSNSGVQYSLLGSTSATQISSIAPTSLRVANIQNGQLYVSAASGTFHGIGTVGSGVPTTGGQVPALLPGFPTGAGPSSYGFYFANPSTVYVADDRSVGAGGGIQKWVFGGGNWTLAYTLNTGLLNGCRGLSGYVYGGTARLFATTAAAGANSLVRVDDTGAAAPFLTLDTAMSNTAFRGVCWVPGGVPTPSATQGPANGTSGNYFTAGGINRFQIIYDSSCFTSQGVLQPISLTHVEFEWGAATPLAVVTYPSVSIYLQPSATDWAAQSTTYAANRTVAFPTTPNFAGPITTKAGAYYVRVPLTTPISYDPTLGVDLLVEVELNGAPTPATGNSQRCTINPAVPANFCNVKRSVGSLTALVGANSQFVPLVNFSYSPAPNAGVATPIGAGCISKFTSIYELFSAPVNFDLQNSSMTFLNLGGSYAVFRNLGAWLPIGSVQAIPTVLTLGDDTDTNYAFTVGSFPGWAGVQVCSNGYVAAAAGNSLVAQPSAGTCLNNPQPAFYSQMDLDPIGGTGFGTIQAEESPAVTTITWNGVSNWNNPTGGSGAAPCNIQFQLYPSGDVTIAWQNFTTLTSNGGVLVGYSPGGASADPGSHDVSAIPGAGVVLEAIDTLPLALASLSRPVINATWNLQVRNIPTLPFQVGVEIYGLSDPGINDLFFIGAPGCGLRANLDILNPFLQFAPATTHNYGLALPSSPSLVNVQIYAQSAMLDPSYNSFGVITSNGISGLIGF